MRSTSPDEWSFCTFAFCAFIQLLKYSILYNSYYTVYSYSQYSDFTDPSNADLKKRLKGYLMVRYLYNLSILRLSAEGPLRCTCPDRALIAGEGHELVRTRYAGVNVTGGFTFTWKDTSDPLELLAMSVKHTES